MNRLWRTPLETAWDADRFDLAEWMAAQESIPQLTSADAQASRDLSRSQTFAIFMSEPTFCWNMFPRNFKVR